MERICNLSIPATSHSQKSLTPSIELQQLKRRFSLTELDNEHFWDEHQQQHVVALPPPGLVICGSGTAVHTSCSSIASSNDIAKEQNQDNDKIGASTSPKITARRFHMVTLLPLALCFLLVAYIQNIRMELVALKTKNYAAHDSAETSLRPGLGPYEAQYDKEVSILLSEIRELETAAEENTTTLQQSNVLEKNLQDTTSFLHLANIFIINQYQTNLHGALEDLQLLHTKLDRLSAENMALQRSLHHLEQRNEVRYEKEMNLLLSEVRDLDNENRCKEDRI